MMNPARRRLLIIFAALIAAQSCATRNTLLVEAQGPLAPGAVRLKAEVWADNWFAMYLGDSKIAEDSEPITKERSFNAETFTFDAKYPMELNFVIKDFIQDDTGLEYIGKRNQQMGDGGFIMQLTDTATGRLVAVSDSKFHCLVIHKAPLNPECEKSQTPASSCRSMILPEPLGWKSPGYDMSAWVPATLYTAKQVGPKGGYDKIRWNAAAKLIWTSDLKADNTLLCKVQIPGD